MMLTDDYTFKFGNDGIILNTDVPIPDANSDFTPFIDVTNIEGLDSPEFRITDRDREGQDGGFVDVEFEKMRNIVIDGTVYAPANRLEAFLDDLKYNYGPSNDLQPFFLIAPSTNERVVFCKSRGVRYSWATARRTGTVEIQISLTAEDPAIYDSIPVTDDTGLAQVVGGRGYNKAYNFGYAGLFSGTDFYVDEYVDDYGTALTPSDGSCHITNGGNRPTGAIIQIFGPIRNPSVVHDTSGRQLSFNIELIADQYLTIDLRNRTVRLNDSANRRHTMLSTSRWFLLPPGENSLRLLGVDPTSGAPDPMMVVTARGAYR